MSTPGRLRCESMFLEEKRRAVNPKPRSLRWEAEKGRTGKGSDLVVEKKVSLSRPFADHARRGVMWDRGYFWKKWLNRVSMCTVGGGCKRRAGKRGRRCGAAGDTFEQKKGGGGKRRRHLSNKKRGNENRILSIRASAVKKWRWRR